MKYTKVDKTEQEAEDRERVSRSYIIKFPHLAHLQELSLKEEILETLRSGGLSLEAKADQILVLVAQTQRDMVAVVGQKMADLLSEFNACDRVFRKRLATKSTAQRLEDGDLSELRMPKPSDEIGG